ncbi:MAG: hypothetical protein ACOYM3_02495 [Terrimicrobiaceae bacterium]
MNKCPFTESVKSLLTTGKCDGEGCPLAKVPPLGHLIIAGAVVLVISVIIGGLISRPRD